MIFRASLALGLSYRTKITWLSGNISRYLLYRNTQWSDQWYCGSVC